MEISLRVLVVLFAGSLLLSCNKDERSSNDSGDKNDMYRDWTKKGKRTPLPTPGRVFNKD